jgi:hydroxyacylglutathione hydrolase
MDSPLKVTGVPAFADNYIWLLERDGRAVVVDPGDAAPARAALAQRALQLAAVFVTHHHADHSGGAAALAAEFGAPVYGPRGEASSFRGLDRPLDEGARFTELGVEFTAWSTPGHTRSPTAFVAPGLLFCGDTLFSAGCGRLFEGTAAQMHASLMRLASLPGDTRMYCGHEYTLANLAFAQAVEPENAALREAASQVRAVRAAGRPSLPSTIADERRINPFLRCAEPAIAQAAERHAGKRLASPVEVFAVLRAWKDSFRAPPDFAV